MATSILNDIKKLLGIEADYDHWDTDIMILINSVFPTLTQLGIGPKGGFNITSADDTWDMFISGRPDLMSIQTYIYDKVRLVFDPPQMGYLVDAINKRCAEFEWRLNVQVENYPSEGD